MSSGPNTPNNLTLDEKLRYYRAVGQLWSLLTWKMADSLALPLDLQGYADFLVHNVQTLVNKYTNVFKNIKDNHISKYYFICRYIIIYIYFFFLIHCQYSAWNGKALKENIRPSDEP